MNYFLDAQTRNFAPPRVHPLLLSLAAEYDKSNASPNIGSIYEDDPRALISNYYSSPRDLPPLDIHFSGQNGAAPSLMPVTLHLRQQFPVENVSHPYLKKIQRR